MLGFRVSGLGSRVFVLAFHACLLGLPLPCWVLDDDGKEFERQLAMFLGVPCARCPEHCEAVVSPNLWGCMQAAESKLGRFVEEMVVPPELITGIVEGEVCFLCIISALKIVLLYKAGFVTLRMPQLMAG